MINLVCVAMENGGVGVGKISVKALSQKSWEAPCLSRDYPPPDLVCGPAMKQQPVSSRPDPGLAGSASKQQAASQQQAGPGPRGVRRRNNLTSSVGHFWVHRGSSEDVRGATLTRRPTYCGPASAAF